MDIQIAKTALREQTLAKIKAIPAKEQAVASRELCELLTQQAVWKSAQSILFFAPMAGEPDIGPLLSEAIELGEGCIVATVFGGDGNVYRVPGVECGN